MAYKSKFRPKNKHKYIGDLNRIICRSTWERSLAKWADQNAAVIKWGIEVLVIPYYDKGNGKRRRYFTDFYFEFKDGSKMVVEVKPENQTKAPRAPQRKTRKYLEKVKTYATNTSKWEAATKFCNENNMAFHIWTEKHLRQLGLKIL